MLRGLLLAESGTELTDFGTERTQTDGKRRIPPHPLRRQQTDVCTVATQSDAADDRVIRFVMRHPDHLVRTGIAEVCAVHARLDAFDGVLLQGMSHGCHARLPCVDQSCSFNDDTLRCVEGLLGKPLVRSRPD